MCGFGCSLWKRLKLSENNAKWFGGVGYFLDSHCIWYIRNRLRLLVMKKLSLICDDAESRSIYQHPACSSCFYYSLLVCTVIWTCVLLYCLTDLHVLQSSTNCTCQDNDKPTSEKYFTEYFGFFRTKVAKSVRSIELKWPRTELTKDRITIIHNGCTVQSQDRTDQWPKWLLNWLARSSIFNKLHLSGQW